MSHSTRLRDLALVILLVKVLHCLTMVLLQCIVAMAGLHAEGALLWTMLLSSKLNPIFILLLGGSSSDLTKKNTTLRLPTIF